MNSLLIPILMIMGGILIGVLLRTFAKFIKIPYTVALFAIGLLFGVAYNMDLFEGKHVLEKGMDMITGMDPDFVLYVFLPILIFDAAYKMDLHVFGKILVNSSILAGPGVVICMLLTSCFVMFMSYLFGGYDPENWKYALMFGGLISATDPVAVVALLNELKTSKRFSTLVDGESLLNDGTGIVCFMMFYSQFAGSGIENPVLYFCWVCLASFVIGYIIAHATLWFLTKICQKEIIQNSVMVVAAYLTFLIAQSTFEVSGVIALVVFGHFFAQRALPRLKPEVTKFMSKFWEFLSEISNTLIFLIVGVIIATKVDITLLRLVEVFMLYIALNVIRYIMIAVCYPFISKIGYGLKFHEAIVLGWGGLRGALGMSLALMVHYNTNIPEEVRDVVLLYTAGVVTLTLCINATTSKLLVNKFKMTKSISPYESQIWKKTIEKIREEDAAEIEALKQNGDLSSANWSEVESKMVPEYSLPENCDDAIIPKEVVTQYLRNTILDRENVISEKLYGEGVITLDSYKAILDYTSLLADFEGTKPFDKMDLKYITKPSRMLLSKKKRLITGFNLGRAFLMVQMECLELLARIEKSRLNKDGIISEQISMVRSEIENLNERILGIIKIMSKAEPEIYSKVLTNRAVRLMLANERKIVTSFVESGIITQDQMDELSIGIDRRQGLEIVE